MAFNIRNHIISQGKVKQFGKRYICIMQGYKAYPDGECPYKKDPEAMLWKSGFDMAKDDAARGPSVCLPIETRLGAPLLASLDYKPKEPKVKKPHATPKKDRESSVVHECMEVCKRFGIPVWRQNTGSVFLSGRFVQFGRRGAGDLTGLMPDTGRRVEIECKRRDGKGKQSAHQKEFEDFITRNQGLYLLATSGHVLAEQLRNLGYNERIFNGA